MEMEDTHSKTDLLMKDSGNSDIWLDMDVYTFRMGNYSIRENGSMMILKDGVYWTQKKVRDPGKDMKENSAMGTCMAEESSS